MVERAPAGRRRAARPCSSSSARACSSAATSASTVVPRRRPRSEAGRPGSALRTVDTCALARRLVRDEVPNCRLGTLADAVPAPHRPTHRALDDAASPPPTSSTPCSSGRRPTASPGSTTCSPCRPSAATPGSPRLQASPASCPASPASTCSGTGWDGPSTSARRPDLGGAGFGPTSLPTTRRKIGPMLPVEAAAIDHHPGCVRAARRWRRPCWEARLLHALHAALQPPRHPVGRGRRGHRLDEAWPRLVVARTHRVKGRSVVVDS